MRRVRDDDLPALLVLAAIGEVRMHQHQARELALRARSRLKRDGVETRDLGEHLLKLPAEAKRPLRAVLVLVRVEITKAR